MTDEHLREADERLTAAVESYLHEVGLAPRDPETPDDPLMLTDVMVVTVRRGFDHRGGKSQTSVLTCTDSSIPILIGMAKFASIRFEGVAANSFLPSEDDQ